MPIPFPQKEKAVNSAKGLAMTWISTLLALLVLCGCTKKGALVGTVTDHQNHPLPGTRVELVGTKSKVQADQTGRFRLPYLPGKLTLHFQSLGHVSKSLTLQLPKATEHALPAVVLGPLPSNDEAGKRMRTALESLMRDSSMGSVRFGDCFTVKELAYTQVLPGDDQYAAALQLTLMSKRSFSWGREASQASQQVAAFTDVVGGFEVRGYPPGYTFTRALRVTVDVDPGSGESLGKLEPIGSPGADVSPPSRDFSTFIVGQWNGGPTFDFRADGTWSVQNAGSSADTKGRRWSIQGDTLTMVEPAHVTRYTKLSVQGQQLTMWNDGPLTLTRIQSVVALNVVPTRMKTGAVSSNPTPTAPPSTPSPSPIPPQTNATPIPTVQPTSTPKKRSH